MNDKGEWTGSAHFRIMPWALQIHAKPFGPSEFRKYADKLVVQVDCNKNLYEIINSLVKGTKLSRLRGLHLSNRTRLILDTYDSLSEQNPWFKETMTRGLAPGLYNMDHATWGILAAQRKDPFAEGWPLPKSFPKVTKMNERDRSWFPMQCEQADYPDEDLRCSHCILKRWLKPDSGVIPKTVRKETTNFAHVRVGDLAGGASSPPLLRSVFGETAYKPLGDGSAEQPFRLQV